MWSFAWMFGVGFAVLLSVTNVMWGENEAARAKTRRDGEDGARARTRQRSLQY